MPILFPKKLFRALILHHASGVDGKEVVLWELLAADVESIEGICFRLKCKKIARLREEVVSDEKLYTH